MKKFADIVLKFRLEIIIITLLTTFFFVYQFKDAKANFEKSKINNKIFIIINEV